MCSSSGGREDPGGTDEQGHLLAERGRIAGCGGTRRPAARDRIGLVRTGIPVHSRCEKAGADPEDPEQTIQRIMGSRVRRLAV